MHTNRLTIKTAVYVIFEKDGKTLFLRRYNTGWSDGLYTLPAGHIDPGEKPLESAVREIKEEICLDVSDNQLELVHVMFEKDAYIDFYFLAHGWVGSPRIGEEEKCDKMDWLNLDAHYSEIIPKIALVLKNIQEKKIYSEIDRV